ncbi:MAG TPA: calcium-binding protein [Rhizobiaceae bacterium]|nr:calcium-binding protein [Rhizobiaceae bacterium]
MAIVHVGFNASMYNLLNGWSGSSTSGPASTRYISRWDSDFGMGIAGVFSPNISATQWQGTVTEVFLRWGDEPQPAIHIQTSFAMSFATYQWMRDGIAVSFIAAVLFGNDTLYGDFADEDLVGFGGNDILIGGAGADDLDGDDGIDTASYANASTAVLVDMMGASSGDAAGDAFFSIENLAGSRFSDRLYANNGVNRLSGGLGNDTLVGRLGADTLDGGAGVDTASYDASFDNVRASLLNPALNTDAAAGDTYISIENIAGGSFNDTLYGNNSANKIEANKYPGATNLIDNDKLFGMGGNDTLFGYRGNDVLTGGLGKDTQTGGLGRDIFDFNSIAESVVGANRDVITDFTRGNNVTGDDIDLSTIDARTTLAGNQNFIWRGAQAFSKVAGQLRFTDLGATCLVQGDVNGDGKADFEISVRVATLSAADFIL